MGPRLLFVDSKSLQFGFRRSLSGWDLEFGIARDFHVHFIISALTLQSDLSVK
jgi:hypothetical protein